MTTTTEEKSRIETLKKITVTCKAGTAPGGDDLASGNERFDFVYGLATEGLTPFEFKIGGKSAGETVDFAVPARDICKTFQHLTVPGLDTPGPSENVHFSFHIESVETPDSREVIKAMAELNACGGGSCDCCGH